MSTLCKGLKYSSEDLQNKEAPNYFSRIAHRYRCVSHANVSNAVKEIDQRIKIDRKPAGVIRKIKEAVFKLNSK